MSGARNIVKQSISQGSFLIVQKTLLRYLEDANATLILSNLVSLRDYFDSIHQLIDKEWFFQTIDKMEYDLGLSSTKQTHAIKLLEEKGLIQVRKMGRPCTRYFKICDEAIADILGNPVENPEKVEKEKYYLRLNEELNSNKSFSDVEKKARDNMNGDVFGVMFCITRSLKPLLPKFIWTSTEVGRIRGFVLKESSSKLFDIPRYIRAMKNILHQKRNIPTSFEYITEIINQFYNENPTASSGIEATRMLTPEMVVQACKV